MMDEWNKTYKDELDGLGATPMGRKALLHRLTARRESAKRFRPRRVMRTAVALGLAACVLTAAVGAAVVGVPVLRDYFGGAYDKNAATVGRSITKNGWTMTITDLVGDDQYFYLGIELSAPEGTVLDAEYYGVDGVVFMPEIDNTEHSPLLRQIDDGDPTDNRLHFVYMEFRINGSSDKEDSTLRGKNIELSLNGLYKQGTYNEETNRFDHDVVCGETWDFGAIKLDYPDNAIRLTPNLPVTTLGVEAVITSVEVTPLSVIVTIEGDALKGHHSWVPKNAPDGWYGCIEYQEVTLYDENGNAVLPDSDGADNNGVNAGSGCSGGTDPTEPGRLTLERNYGYLLDMDSLDHLTVCGVEIPLH